MSAEDKANPLAMGSTGRQRVAQSSGCSVAQVVDQRLRTRGARSLVAPSANGRQHYQSAERLSVPKRVWSRQLVTTGGRLSGQVAVDADDAGARTGGQASGQAAAAEH